MRPFVPQTVAALFCLCAALPADDQPPAGDAEATPEVLVYPVRNTPPDQIVNALQSLYGDEGGLRITTAPGGRTLLLRVDPQLRDDVLTILENVDPPANRLAVQVALIHRLPDADATDLNALSGPAGEVWNAVRNLEQRGQVSVSDRIQATTLENQQTMVSFGQQRPVVTGVQTSGRGNASSMFQQQNTGTLLTFTGRSTPDGDITLQIQFEKSEIVELPETPIQEGVAASGTDTTVVRSTVPLRSGMATLLSAAGSDDEHRQDSFLVLTVTVLRPGEDRVAGLFDRAGQPDRIAGFEGRGGGIGGTDTDLARMAFDRFDRNHDGVLQPDEVPAFLGTARSAEWTFDAYREWLAEHRSSASFREPTFGAGRSLSSRSDSDRVARIADATFQRLDRNQDGILQADELPVYLDGDSDSEWDPDEVRQWFLENPSTALRFSTFGAERSRSSDAAARGRFGGASRGGFGGSSRGGFSGSSRGGFGGFSSGGFRLPRTGLLGMLLRDDVLQLLELTAEQRAQAEELVRNSGPTFELSQRMRDVIERLRNADDGQREQIAGEMAELRRQQEEQTEQKLAEILSAEKMARLRQLDLQYSGSSALLRDDVAAALNLTDEQKSRLQEMSDEASQRRREEGFPASTEQRAAQERQQNKGFFGVLTDEQRQAWLDMVGDVVVDNGTPRN